MNKKKELIYPKEKQAILKMLEQGEKEIEKGLGYKLDNVLKKAGKITNKMN
jgi:hypothetical protein